MSWWYVFPFFDHYSGWYVEASSEADALRKDIPLSIEYMMGYYHIPLRAVSVPCLDGPFCFWPHGARNVVF